MTNEPNSDLAEALASVRRPLETGPLPPAELDERLATTLWLRRLAPTALMVRRSERRARAIWRRHREERARARAAMEAIVAGTHRAHEVDSLARAFLVEETVEKTLFWQPWKRPSVDETSAERLRETLDAGRGVLVSPSHLGPYIHGLEVIACRGRTPYSLSSWVLDPPTPGYWGRRIMRRRAEARANGEGIVAASGSFALLKKMLEEGEVVSIMFDMPGSRQTHFLGKPVMLASGSARLAVQTGAPVLPIRTRRVGHRLWVDVESPLYPSRFTGWEELHAALAAVHERLILELPATSEDPNREGAWEGGATAEAWIRPERRPPGA